MCVAVPGQIVWIGEGSTTSIPARIAVGASEFAVDLVMVPEAHVGDHVIAHSGYAVKHLTPAEADETHALLEKGRIGVADLL